MYMDPGKRLSPDEATLVETRLVETCKTLASPYSAIGMKDFLRSMGWGYGRMPDVRRHLDSPETDMRERLTRSLGQPVGDIFCTREYISVSEKMSTLAGRMSQDEREAKLHTQMSTMLGAYGVDAAIEARASALGSVSAGVQSALSDVVWVSRRNGISDAALLKMLREELSQ